MIEPQLRRDDVDRSDHPARVIIAVGRRTGQAVAGQVEGDAAVRAAEPLHQRLPRLEAGIRAVQQDPRRPVAAALVPIMDELDGGTREIDRSSCVERVCQYLWI